MKLGLNRRGEGVTTLLLFLIAGAAISAIFLALIQAGVLESRDEYTGAAVLNTEFLPGERDHSYGSSLSEITLCSQIDRAGICLSDVESYRSGETIFVYVTNSDASRALLYEGDVAIDSSQLTLSSGGSRWAAFSTHGFLPGSYRVSVDDLELSFMLEEAVDFVGE